MGTSSLYYSGVFYFTFVTFTLRKSSQFPFSRWLPKAISAPTPTRALVHSSTLVTAGLVLIISFSEIIGLSLLILILFIGGMLTIFMGRALSLIESRIKKVVAFRTLSQIGLASIIVGLGNFYLSSLYLIAHGFAKSLLFIQVGYFIHNNYGQQNTRL